MNLVELPDPTIGTEVSEIDQATSGQRERSAVAGINASFDDLTLYSKPKRGQKVHLLLGNAVVGASMERTIEAASAITITCYDPALEILNLPEFGKRFNAEIENLWFKLTKISKQGNNIALTFEDREVAWLRKYKGVKKAYRDRVTRAEFVNQLRREVKEGKIKFYCPQLHKTQPIKSAKEAKAAKKSDPSGGRQPGFHKNTNLSVKGVRATAEQLNIGERSLTVAESHKSPYKAKVALIAALIVESVMKNTSGGDDSSVGALQLLSMHGSVQRRMDLEWCVDQFLTKGFRGLGGAIQLAKSGMGAAEIAQAVQGAAAPTYGSYLNEARKWVDEFEGGDLSEVGASTEVSVPQRYAYMRKKKETSWDCMGRLASEVNWRRFMVGGKLFFVAEKTLMKTRPRIIIGEEEPGVIDVDFDYDMGKPVTEATVTAKCRDWGCPPGTVAVIGKEYGPAAGRYIVSSISSDFFTDDATITLRKPMKALAEPANEVKTKTVKSKTKKGKGRGEASASGLDAVNIQNASPGAPAWGGARAVFHQFVDPFLGQYGISPGAQKETGHAVGGDHDPNMKLAYATDYPTYNGTQAANALMRAMGASGIIGTFTTFTIKVDGYKFAVQILWHVEDHYDHIHVGMHRI